MAWYKVWPCGHGMVYVIAWRGMVWYMVWPGGHGMGKGMACRAWHSIWYGLTLVYDIPWLAWHGIWYGLVGIAWIMAWPSGHNIRAGTGRDFVPGYPSPYYPQVSGYPLA